jgi:hypothetical protein
MRHTTLVVVVAVGLLAGAASSCGGASTSTGSRPAATVDVPVGSVSSRTTVHHKGDGTSEPPRSTTTAPTPTSVPSTPTTLPVINPDVVPTVITPAYVNAVFKVLNHLYGNALRLDLQTVNIPPQSVADLRAIYNDPLYGQELTIASQTLTGNLSNVRMPPGDQVTQVTKVISATPACIFVAATTSVAKVVFNQPMPNYEYFELRPKQVGADPQGLNLTPWAISAAVIFSVPTPEADPCPAS